MIAFLPSLIRFTIPFIYMLAYLYILIYNSTVCVEFEFWSVSKSRDWIKFNPSKIFSALLLHCIAYDEVMNSWSFAITLEAVYFELVTVYLFSILSIELLLTIELELSIYYALKIQAKVGLWTTPKQYTWGGC